jgi:hypothetical protein
MMAELCATRGNYRFTPGAAVSPYSGGGIADPGYEIVHATLQSPLPIWDGFAAIERYLSALQRPRAALCALELRCAKPYDPAEWMAPDSFNLRYVAKLREWGLLVDGLIPVARTNVAPILDPPAEQVVYAFSYTIPTADPAAPPTFIVAGSAETPTVRPGERTPDALLAKTADVMATMHARLTALGARWEDVTAAGLYLDQACDLPLLEAILAPMGPAASSGIHWFYSKPPISDRVVEIDLRGVRTDLRVRL